MADIEIRQLANGFTFKGGINREEVYLTLDELFARILLYIEGRSKEFTGNAYGQVVVERELPVSASASE